MEILNLGEVAEWLNAAVSKIVKVSKPSRVQIPPSPLIYRLLLTNKNNKNIIPIDDILREIMEESDRRINFL